ncbi:MAG TPA: hypothetical protein VKJ65_07110, partial [Phycisphaerae bacterium]|nr:hypothetical protein [Phycisphaerae bacterium]
SAISSYVTADLLGLTGGYNNTGYLLQPDPLSGSGDTQGNPDGQLPQELLMGSSALPGYSSPVPEPSTVLAGALLLLPLGASAIRILRKSKSI